MKIAGQTAWRIVRRGDMIMWNRWLSRGPLPPVGFSEALPAAAMAGETGTALPLSEDQTGAVPDQPEGS